jgi:hypothetical protein
MSRKTAFILGAGFSDNAGLPLQSSFTKELLKAREFKKGPSKALVEQLDEFVAKVFGWNEPTPLDLYPELEDIFTSIDLSANSGHYLGTDFSPKDLRQIRRILISRTIRMLHSLYLNGALKDPPETKRTFLLEFVGALNTSRHEIVSLNWDGVLEGCTDELDLAFDIQYSPDIEPQEIKGGKLVDFESLENTLRVSKVHGSINWLYCDCCRRSFSIPIKNIEALANQVLKKEEAKVLYGNSKRIDCPKCGVDLSVRLATFSYRKALRAPMFESSWLQAEKSLREAQKWVFIGYSLPQADYEFKYLLKRVELARAKPLQIQVVTVNGLVKGEDSPTVKSYKKFFGRQEIEFFRDGLNRDVISKTVKAK